MATISSDIFQAKQLLEKGEIIGLPTETVYGLAGNAYHQEVILNIFKIKKRPKFDPLIVHTNCITRIKEFVLDIPCKALELAAHFCPGPLTILLLKKNNIADIVTSGLSYVGVRIPNHPLTQALLSTLSFPLAAPSANPFGYISPTTSQHVNDQLGEQIPYILEGGSCKIGIESTIISFEKDPPIVYRLGGIDIMRIEQIIGPVAISLQHLPRQLMQAPGTGVSHYAPNKDLKIGNINNLIEQHKDQRIGVLAFDHYYQYIDQSLQVILSSTGNLDEAAMHLFAALRQLDKLPIDIILTDLVPHIGIGVTINDRLTRASKRDA